MTREDASLLLHRLTKVLFAAASHLEKLDQYATHRDKGEDCLLRRQDKVAAEALLLSYIASRVPRQTPETAAAIDAVCRSATPHIASGRNEALLRRFPQTVATIGGSYVLLSALGRPQPGIDRLLRDALSQGFATVTERSTFRLMDTRWTYSLLDSALVGPVHELLSLSTLGSSPHPIYTMNEDNYALTHAVYCLTDFGGAPSQMLQHSGNQLLDPFLSWNAIRTDLDLVGEFLIASRAAWQPTSPTFRFAWHLLFQEWADNGGLAGPEFSADRWAELSGEEADAYAFWQNYHTTFVAGIVCAVALTVPETDGELPLASDVSIPDELGYRCLAAATRAREFAPAASDHRLLIPQANELPEWVTSRLLVVLGVSPVPPPPWLRAAMSCDLSRDDLACVLYDALVVEAAKSYRLVQLAEALAVGASHKPLRSPTLIRGLDFLLKQQLDDGFIGVNRLLAADQDLTQAAEAQAAIAQFLGRAAVALRT